MRSVVFVFVVVTNSVFAEVSPVPNLTLTPQQMLVGMNKAISQYNYEMTFIKNNNSQFYESFKYFHINSKDKSLGHLLFLEGTPKEVILNDDIVSYFFVEGEPFSLNSSRIVESFPKVIFNDFENLNNYYDYSFIGKGRVSNHRCQLVKIMAKNKDRYNYVIWLEETTLLPLRIDLFSLENELLEQFKVVDFSLLTSIEDIESYIENTNTPILLANQLPKTHSDVWEFKSLPAGFKEIQRSSIEYKETGIETYLYSDGVFLFTVSVSDINKTNEERAMSQGNRIIYSTVNNNKNIIIIGNLPLTTIKDIAKNIVIK